jgi:N-acyl-D-amino-acid deacylase
MKESGVQVEYSHLIFVGKSSWNCVGPMLKSFHDAVAQGYNIAYDMYPFTYGASVITVVLPGWYLKLSKEERRKPFNLFKLKLIINITKKLLGIDFGDMVISYVGKDYPQYEGKNVAEIAKEEHMKPIDAYLKLVDLSDGKGGMMLGKYYNDDIITRLMKDDLSIYMTDAWYEASGTQNGGAYQAFPLFLMKTKTLGIPLEETIHKMTGATVDRFHIPNRGYIREGYAADITIFNYDEININQGKPDETPEGIRYVIVNGDITVADKRYTGATNGKLIRKNA